MSNQADAAVEGSGVQVNNQATVLTPQYQRPPGGRGHRCAAVPERAAERPALRQRALSAGPCSTRCPSRACSGHAAGPTPAATSPSRPIRRPWRDTSRRRTCTRTGRTTPATSTRPAASCSSAASPDGFTTNMAYTNAKKDQDVFQSVQQALAPGQHHGEPVADRPETASSSVTGVPSDVKKRGLGIINTNWAPDFPAPYGFYYSLVDGEAILQESNTQCGGDQRTRDQQPDRPVTRDRRTASSTSRTTARSTA